MLQKQETKTGNAPYTEIIRIDQLSPNQNTSGSYDSRRREEYYREFQVVYKDILTGKEVNSRKKVFNYDITMCPLTVPSTRPIKRPNREEVKMVKVDVPTFGLEQAVVEKKYVPHKLRLPKKVSNEKIRVGETKKSQKVIQTRLPTHNKAEQADFFDQTTRKMFEANEQLQQVQQLIKKRKEALKFSPNKVSTKYMPKIRPTSVKKKMKTTMTTLNKKISSIRDVKMKYKSLDHFFKTIEYEEGLKKDEPKEVDYLMKERSFNDSSTFCDEPNLISTYTIENRQNIESLPEQILQISNYEDEEEATDSKTEANRSSISNTSDHLMSTLKSIKTDLELFGQPPDVKISRFVDKGKYFDTKTPTSGTLKKIEEITKSMRDVDRICRDIDKIKSEEAVDLPYPILTASINDTNTYSLLNIDKTISRSSYLSKEFNLNPDTTKNKNQNKMHKMEFERNFPHLAKKFTT